MSKTSEWLKKGFDNIWLPYTQMKTSDMPLPVIDAKDCIIKLEDGRELIDGIASWWSVCHGYNNPHIINAVKSQLEKLPHIMFAGFAHEPAYKLATKLCDILPKGLEKVFFSDSGSTAVEVAMKMAVQYWHNQGDNKKNKFISFRNSYHGDTMGAMSLTDTDKGMHKVFNNYMPMQYVIDIPYDEYSFDDFKNLISGIKKNVAGLIIEPLVQCAGGMKFQSSDILYEIHKVCKENDIIFIADEIATGFYRTGMLFACNEVGIVPDIICLGKALTGGTMTLAATVTRKKIFDVFLNDNIDKAFMHGPTYMANPLACSAALASLEMFEKYSTREKVDEIEKILTNELEKCRKLKNVKDVRVKGAIGVVQLKEADWDYIFSLRKRFVECGIWLRPFADVIYVMPPFTISKEQLKKITETIYNILKG